jgi:hypothetical protein
MIACASPLEMPITKASSPLIRRPPADQFIVGTHRRNLPRLSGLLSWESDLNPSFTVSGQGWAAVLG